MAGLLQYYYFPTDFFYPKPNQLSIKSETINNNSSNQYQHQNQNPPPQQQNPNFEGSTQVEFDSDDSSKKMMNRSVSGRDLRMPTKAVKASISLQEFEKDAMEEASRQGVERESYSMLEYDREMEAIRTAAGGRQYNENVRLWIWALAHSKSPEHVKEAMLILQSIHEMEGIRWVTVRNYMIHSPLTRQEEYYFSALGDYRDGQYLETLVSLGKCLKVEPNWGPALCLQELIEYKMTKAGNSVALVSASVLGVIAGFIYGTVSPESFLPR